MVGDNLSDIQLGKNINAKKTIRIGQKRCDIMELQHQLNIFPDYTSSNLLETAKLIESIEAKAELVYDKKTT